MEGSLFLVKRSQMPRFRFVILNKKSAENYVEDVEGGFEAELNSPYLLYRNKAKEVIGIWFFEESDCKRVADLITRISSTFAAPTDADLGGTETDKQEFDNSEQIELRNINRTGTAGANGVDKHHNDDESDGLFWDKSQSISFPVAVPAAQGTDDGQSSLLAKMFPSLAVNSSNPPLPSRPSMQLLTPQFLQQQQQQQHKSQSQGDYLLQELQKRLPGLKTADIEVPSTAGGRAGKQNENTASMSTTGAAVASLLRSLAENATFCRELEQEMVRAGFFVPSPP